MCNFYHPGLTCVLLWSSGKGTTRVRVMNRLRVRRRKWSGIHLGGLLTFKEQLWRKLDLDAAFVFVVLYYHKGDGGGLV